MSWTAWQTVIWMTWVEDGPVVAWIDHAAADLVNFTDVELRRHV
jgi:hypothetical protein